MARLQPLVATTVVLGLIALAAFGVWQVIGGSGEAQEGPALETTSFDPENVPSSEEQRETIREFVASGNDPCSLPTVEPDADHWFRPNPNVASLINDVDLIVVGRPTGRKVESPKALSIAGRILITLDVEDVLLGTTAGDTIAAYLAGGVMNYYDGLVHVVNLNLNSCLPDRLLLFLYRTRDPDVFSILYQGWARIEGDSVEAGRLNGLYDGYSNSDALVSAVRSTADEQELQSRPKGFLLCQFRRTSALWEDPIVCPGESFNPYQAFRLASAQEAFVLTSDPGPSPAYIARADLAPGPRLSALLATLQTEVTLEPADGNALLAEDVISLHVSTNDPVNDRTSYTFSYSPSSGMVQMTISRGQFPAPPAFQAAMEPFLASSVVE